GKGSKDCFIETSVSPVPPIDPNTGAPTAKIVCTDNDPTCDNDTTPGQCTFLVSECVNVADPRLASCTPNGAASYILKKPSDKDATKPHKNRFDRDNRRGVDTGLAGVVPTGAQVCTPESRFVVPV